MAGYLSLAERNSANIRKGLQGSVFIANSTAAAVTKSGLFDATTGDLKALPAGYTDLGWLTDTGAKKGRAVTSTDIGGWGTTQPLRTDITKDTSTLVVECQETKFETMALAAGIDPTTIVPDPTNGTIEIQQALLTSAATYRVLVVSVDELTSGEYVIADFFPRASVTAYGDQTFANAAAATTWPFTFTAYPDPVLGYSVDTFIGGAGHLAQLGDEEVPRVVVCTTATTTALVATTGTFTSFDVGRHVSGAGITAGTTIATFTDSTHVVLSATTTATATGVSVTIT